MAKHNEIGKKGEKLAQSYLLHQGYQILEMNWRFSRAEIDLIVRKEALLIFVEVKTQRKVGLLPPEAKVGPHKQKLLADAAMRYMEQIGHEWEIRFDIISVWLKSDFDYQIKHFEDAFFPSW